MRGLLPAIKHIVLQSESSYTSPFWILTQVTGDLNHRVYHAQAVHDEQHDLMVKIFQHTNDQLAWREYSALRALWSLEPHRVSPIPLFLLESHIAPDLDVLITEWLDGHEVELSQAFNKIQWTVILHTLAEVHQMTPETTRIKLPDSVMCFDQPLDFIHQLDRDFVELQDDISNPVLLDFVQRVLVHLEQSLPHEWTGNVPKTLIHGDWHIHNFVQSDEGVRFFDWEMAGWGDPAMDIALLLTHESFADVSLYDQRWLVTTYQEIQQDETFVQRVDVYTQLLDVAWLIDTARRQIEKPSDGLRTRLDLYRGRIAQRYSLSDS